MSDISTKSGLTKNISEELVTNACNLKEATTENPWIIGISKTHPGLKYYFNTVTGVSLWNISKEDMERANIQHIKLSGNSCESINYPEPQEPPPKRKSTAKIPTQTYSDHIVQHNKPLSREDNIITCDICYNSVNTSPNVITVNVSCPHARCIPPSEKYNKMVMQQHVQSSTTLKTKHDYHGPNMSEDKRSLNRCIANRMVQGPSNTEGHTCENSEPDKELFEGNTTELVYYDLAPLKFFARSNLELDKWYIIADADVYLHHISFLKAVLNSDHQCCLMVPQNVRIELENATKTQHRTKAYCASYFIYKLFDYGFALIEEDYPQEDKESIQSKTDTQHILDCCTKLNEENYFVVVISNNLELQKCRTKITIPIFTVAELKEYLSRSSKHIPTGSNKSSVNIVQGGNNSTSNCMSSVNYNLTHTAITSNPDKSVKINRCTQTEFVSHSVGTQLVFGDTSKRTIDVEVQTNFSPMHIGNDFTKTCTAIQKPIQITETNTRNEDLISHNKSCESLLNSSNQNSGRHFKLRRKKYFNQQHNSANLVSPNTNPDISNNISFTCNNKTVNDTNEKIVSNINDSDVNQKDTGKSNICTMKNKSKKKEMENIRQNQCHLQTAIRQSNEQNEEVENKNVMFEINSESMKESLKTKCDEWVSRFVQIMEEALSQILRKNTRLCLPPPWNIFEATMCVGKAFKADADVADASTKLLSILNLIRDEKGNINAQISPTKYMEMYSFGVYLIDALQGVFLSCEDLQIAAESLSKLLSDIQNPESDQLESFNCTTQEKPIFYDTESSNDKVEVLMIVDTLETETDRQELAIDDDIVNELTNENCGTNISQSREIETNVESSSKKRVLKRDIDTNKNKLSNVIVDCGVKTKDKDYEVHSETTPPSNASAESPRGYNLRSRLRRMSIGGYVTEQNLTEDRNIRESVSCKDAFLSNLFLQSTTEPNGKNDNEAYSNERPATALRYSEDEQSSHKESNEIDSNRVNDNLSESVDDLSTNFHEPTIIRNFVMCSEFENRLRTRYVHEELDEFDFDDETDYVDEGRSSCATRSLHINEYEECLDNDDIEFPIEYENSRDKDYFKTVFRRLATKIMQEIKDVSSKVYAFSINSCEELSLTTATDDIEHIRERAEQYHVYLDQLCTALNNILNRSKNGNIASNFSNTELNNFVDEDEKELYMAFIARCLERAHDLKNTIEDVLSAVDESA